MREVISLPEVARMLGVKKETARRWAVSKRIPVFRYDGVGQWRAFRDEIDKYIASQQTSTSTGQVGGAH